MFSKEQSPRQEIETEETRSLTRRQMEILEFIAQGLSNKEIGRILGIKIGTVRSLIYQKEYSDANDGIFARLKVESRRGAVVKAAKLDLINPEEFVSIEELVRVDSLSLRQLEVGLCLTIPDDSLEQAILISQKLLISPRTAKNHLTAIYRKLDIRGESSIKGAQAAVVFLAYQQREQKLEETSR